MVGRQCPVPMTNYATITETYEMLFVAAESLGVSVPTPEPARRTEVCFVALYNELCALHATAEAIKYELDNVHETLQQIEHNTASCDDDDDD